MSCYEKIHVFENNMPFHAFESHGAIRRFILRFFVQHFACTLKAGERLRDLRPEHHHLADGRNQHRQKRAEREKISWRHRAGANEARAEEHDRRANNTHQHCGGKAHQRRGRKSLEYVIKEPLRAQSLNTFSSRSSA